MVIVTLVLHLHADALAVGAFVGTAEAIATGERRTLRALDDVRALACDTLAAAPESSLPPLPDRA